MVFPLAVTKLGRSPRRAFRVSNCGDRTRRDLIKGLLTSATSATSSRLESRREMSSKVRAAHDANFARTMDVGTADYEQHMSRVKQRLFRDSAGKDVLELGVNTGPDPRYFKDAQSVVGVEPNVESFGFGFGFAMRNAEIHGLERFALKPGIGERLPMKDAGVDAVVSTLGMCTVSDLKGVAHEVRRVLRPGGYYILVSRPRRLGERNATVRVAETVRFDPLNGLAYEGCRLTRDPESAARDVFGSEPVSTSRFVAGAAANSWLVGEKSAFSREGSFMDAIEPHFLLSPTLVGRAEA